MNFSISFTDIVSKMSNYDNVLITYSKCLYLIHKKRFDDENLKCIKKFQKNAPLISDKERDILINILKIIHDQSPPELKNKSKDFYKENIKDKEEIDNKFLEFSEQIHENERQDMIHNIHSNLYELVYTELYNSDLIRYIVNEDYIPEDFLNAYDIVCYSAIF
uniref:Uncharacterized protein n=1 Tax=viral metagenome TaxID=1070528 RepID=A0A6C0HEK3_9ZZZZ